MKIDRKDLSKILVALNVAADSAAANPDGIRRAHAYLRLRDRLEAESKRRRSSEELERDALLERAAELIALNDDPGGSDALSVKAVAGYVSTSIVAWTFEISPTTLARRIVKIRKESA